jgi:hypothetical protein
LYRVGLWVANELDRAKIVIVEAAMIRGQAFWVFVLFLGMLLLMLVLALKRAHAPLTSDVSGIIALELLYALVIAATCIRIQRRLAALQGQAEQKSIEYISQTVYILAAFSYMATMFLTPHMRIR